MISIPQRASWIAIIAGALCQFSSLQAKPTNFLFFLVDDLGWADVGCFGSTFHETPNIDALANSGMRFTQAYAAGSVCSPTRASILTGRHPVRLNITDWIPGQPNRDSNRLLHPEDLHQIPLEEVTIAEALKSHNYDTFFAGKWHLGDEGHWPTDQGFDINIGGNSKGSPPGGYYAPWENPTLQAKNEDEYLTERLTSESIQFLNQRDENRPFLLYLSYYNVHTPIKPYKTRIEHFEDKAKLLFDEPKAPGREREGHSRSRQDNPAFASMVSAVDISVGSLLKELDRLNLSDNTVVVFFSDNGGLSTLSRGPGPTCNSPLRAGKGWLYEGGIREPAIIRAPGVTTPGSVCNTSIVSMDFFPTFLELAALPSRPDLHIDGQSLVPLLSGKKGPSRAHYWHYPHYHGSSWKPGAAILDNGWKLIEFYHYDTFELYHLDQDLSEKQDLAKSHPAKAQELRDKLRHWQQRMHAQMPLTNPNYSAPN